MDPVVAQVEALCAVLYAGAPGDPTAAQEELVSMSTSPAFIPQWQAVLDNSKNDYAIFVGANALYELCTQHWTSFTVAQRVDIREFALAALVRAARCVVVLGVWAGGG